MSLAEYRHKRKPSSPEPAIKDTEKKKTNEDDWPVFVVQMHNARHLHYDFRLEYQGSLKSWAVPKGPPSRSTDKHLAIMVEDHPFDYKNFEGIIPKGNYGAGEVIIWDEGVFRAINSRTKRETEQKLEKGLKEGKFSFILSGKKLRGEYALVKIAKGEDNAWLFLKKRDLHEGELDIDKEDYSVKTGHKIGDYQAQESELAYGKLKRPRPRKIEPMLAKLTDKPFDRTGWLYEIKWDGYRIIADIENTNVSLYSRHGNSYNDPFDSIRNELAHLGINAILDGEVVALDGQGKPSFEELQNIRSGADLVYFIFDLLYLDGYDLRSFPLKNRKELLEKLFENKRSKRIQLSEYVKEKGIQFYDEVIAKNDFEGMVAKNAESTYQSGKRSDNWLKIKNQLTLEAAIVGYTEGFGGRKIGALILALNENNTLKYIGHVGSGFSAETEDNLLNKFKDYETGKSPLNELVKTNARVTWLKPKFVAEVRYTEKTTMGILRHSVYLGLREDKEPDEAVEEQTSSPGVELLPEENRKDKTISVDGNKIKIVNYQKKLWPEDGITKFDLANYYLSIAPYLLKYLKDRPESLHRFPHGIHDQAFYQKNTSELQLPDWIETIDIESESERGETKYILCQNPGTLAYLANLACLEVNPWNSRINSLDKPDYIVIDLDPLNVPFKYVREVARNAHEIFKELGISSYCKTSGATGLHIYIPLKPGYSYEQARVFSEILANLVHKNSDNLTSLERSPSKRDKKIYVDYLQNIKGQTLASVYSPRPRLKAPVSAPLKWAELEQDFEPEDFTMKNIFERLKQVGDLWMPVTTTETDIITILSKYNV